MRMSANTAPLGPSPLAVEAMQSAAATAHLYPDRQSDNLAAAFAELEGVDASEVAPSAGSAGAILDLVRMNSGPGTNLVVFDQSFHLYAAAARFAGAGYVTVPVGTSFERDIEAMLDHVDEATSVVVIDNPPNPTSDTLSPPDLTWLLTRIDDEVLVIIDEAYHHFADGHDGYGSMIGRRDAHPRLVVTRTMSKAYGLAGQRVGYAVGPATLLAPLKVQRIPFSVTRVSEAGALAALADDAHTAANIAAVHEGKGRLAQGLRDLGVPVLDTMGNFILFRVGDVPPVVEAFKKEGILVNGLGLYEMSGMIRVSAGAPDEVSAFLEAASGILGGG